MTPAGVFVPDEPRRISMMTVSRRLFLALPAAAAAATLVRPAFALSDAQQLVEKSRLAFLDMITDDNYKEMRDYVKKARALIIFPELIKGAFIIGAEGGSGVLVTRSTSGWSYPAFYTLASGSLGLQIGGQSSELVLTVMSEKALNAVINDQFKVGGNVDVAVGPVGKGLSASTTTNFSSDAYSFAKTQGAYVGISLDGAGILSRESRNVEYYGAGATSAGIVIQRKFTNKNADILRDALSPY
jgi:lipid-binding SYLF domain-containing protein